MRVGSPAGTAAVEVRIMMKVVGIGLLCIVGIGGNGCPTIHTSSRGRIFLLGEVGRGLGTSGEVVVVGATNVEGPLIIELEIV